MQNIILIDLEATCCDKDEFPKEDMEIVEIGAVAVIDGKIHSEFEIVVCPTKKGNINAFLEQLTGLTKERVERGVGFIYALNEFTSWVNPYLYGNFDINGWGSWGHYDKNQFQKDFNRFSIQTPSLFRKDHRNIKNEFKDKFGKRCGVQKALAMIGETFEGNHHRALDDTKNIFKLYRALYE